MLNKTFNARIQTFEFALCSRVSVNDPIFKQLVNQFRQHLRSNNLIAAQVMCQDFGAEWVEETKTANDYMDDLRNL